jgi:peptidoglycan/LPS O-acetylase OafA/YrhL
MAKDVSADGLRGIAALNVLLCHLFISIFPAAFAFIYPGTAAPSVQPGVIERVLAFPLLSVFWNGQFAVCIFFVLSGYVLTKQYLETGDSMILRLRACRRYIRLCVPILGAAMFAYVVLAMGLGQAREEAALTGSLWLTQFWTFDPSWVEALKEGAYKAITEGGSAYNPSLWTMKIELIGSMIVFGYASLTLRGRVGAFAFVGANLLLGTFFPDRWPFYVAFLIGCHVGILPLTKSPVALWAIMVLALICGGFDVSHWYDWTKFVAADDVVRKNIFNVIGGALLLYVVRCGFLDKILQSRSAQYLGRVSYAFYLVHLPIVLSFSAWLYATLAGVLHWHRAAAAVVVLFGTILVVCAVATLFDRTFDRWGITLSRRIFSSRSKPIALVEAASP